MPTINPINPYGAYREARMQNEDRAALTAQNKLAQMYAGNQEQRAAAQETRAQGNYDAGQVAQQQQFDEGARSQVGQWSRGLLSQGLDDAALISVAQQAASNPASADLFKRAGIDATKLDWSNPQQIKQGLQMVAGWGDPAGSSAAAQRETADIQNWRFVQSLNPEQRKEWLAMQRQPTAPQVVTINGVQHLVDRLQGTVTPLSSVQQEAQSQGTIAEGKAIGTARGETIGGQQKKAIGAQNVTNIIDLAEPLIEVATGSTVGAAADAVAAFFGKSTTGAEANSQLRVLEATLILAQPRMEGPQSNADAARYEQAAASIGNPRIPRGTKLAALKTIRDLQSKYAGSAPASSAPAGNAAPATETAAQRAKRLGL